MTCLFRYGLTSIVGIFVIAISFAGNAEQTSQTAAAGMSAVEAEMEYLRRLAVSARSVRSVDALADISGHPSLGEATTDAVIIEFADFQCGFCRRHLNMVMPKLLREYVEPGHVQYVFWDFPVEDRHPEAFQAALAARCADEQGRYWDMRKRLYMSADLLKVPDLLQHASDLGLDTAAFETCLDAGDYTEAVRKDQEKGLSLLVRGTPTFFLGSRVGETGEIRITRSVIGAQSIEVFRSEIDRLMNESLTPAVF